MAEGLLGCMKCAATVAKSVMLVAAIAIAVIMHDVVSCMSLHASYKQIFLSQGDPITMMSLPVHFFRLKFASSCLF